MCVCVCVCVCVSVCVRGRVRACVWVSNSLVFSPLSSFLTYMCMYIHIYIHTLLPHIHIYVYIYIYIHTHTQTHTHTHTHTSPLPTLLLHPLTLSPPPHHKAHSHYCSRHTQLISSIGRVTRKWIMFRMNESCLARWWLCLEVQRRDTNVMWVSFTGLFSYKEVSFDTLYGPGIASPLCM